MDWQPDDRVPNGFENRLNQFKDNLNTMGAEQVLPDVIDPVGLQRRLFRGGAVEPVQDFSYEGAPLLVLAGYVATAASKADELGSGSLADDIVKTAAEEAEALMRALSTRGEPSGVKGALGELVARFACLSYEPFAREGLTRISVSAQAGRRLEGSC